MITKLIILDRDGVINKDSINYIRSPEEWIPIPKSLEAIAKLNQAGFKVVVATNQSGVGRGYFPLERLNAIHQKMRQSLERVGGKIDGIFFCPHAVEANCKCRKPLPGLLVEISERLGIDMKYVPVIGDSYRDLQSAWAVGARGILVKTGKGLNTLAQYKNELSTTEVFADLAAAVEYILETYFVSI